MTEKTTTEKGAKKTSVDLDAQIFNQEGKSVGKMVLPEEIFGLRYNSDLVHQVTKGIAGNKRQGSANTKGRGEVRGGGKKPWKQKGTGRARHGSSRSPIWIGGGTTHGPKSEKNYSVVIPKKMRMKALFTALSRKWKDGEVLFIDNVTLKNAKTKEAKSVVDAIAQMKGFEKLKSANKKVAYLAVTEAVEGEKKAFRNLPMTKWGSVARMNALDILNHKYVVFIGAKDAVAALEAKRK